MTLQQQKQSVSDQISYHENIDGIGVTLPPEAGTSSSPPVPPVPVFLNHLILRVKKQEVSNRRRSRSNVTNISKTTNEGQKDDDHDDSHSSRRMIDVVVEGVKYRFVRRMTEANWETKERRKMKLGNVLDESAAHGSNRDSSNHSEGLALGFMSEKDAPKSLFFTQRKSEKSVQSAERRQQSVKINSTSSVVVNNNNNNNNNSSSANNGDSSNPTLLSRSLSGKCCSQNKMKIDESHVHGSLPAHKRYTKSHVRSAQQSANTNKRRELRLVAIDFYRSSKHNDRNTAFIHNSDGASPIGSVDGGILLTAAIIDEVPNSSNDKQSGDSEQALDTIRKYGAHHITTASERPTSKRRPVTHFLGKRSSRISDPNLGIDGKSLEDHYLRILEADMARRPICELTDDDIDKVILSSFSGTSQYENEELNVDGLKSEDTNNKSIMMTPPYDATSRLTFDESSPVREVSQPEAYQIESKNHIESKGVTGRYDEDCIVDSGYEYYCLEPASAGVTEGEDVDLFFCDEENNYDGEVHEHRLSDGAYDTRYDTMYNDEVEADEDLVYNFSSMSLMPNRRQRQEAWSQHTSNEEHWGRMRDMMENEIPIEGNDDDYKTYETVNDDETQKNNIDRCHYSITQTASSHLRAFKEHSYTAREELQGQQQREAAFLRSVRLQEERERNRIKGSRFVASWQTMGDSDIEQSGEGERNELVFIPDETISGNALRDVIEVDLINKCYTERKSSENDTDFDETLGYEKDSRVPVSKAVPSHVISSELSFQHSLCSGVNGRKHKNYAMTNIGAEDPEVIFAEDDEYDSNNEDHYAYDYADESSSSNVSEEWDVSDGDSYEGHYSDGWIEDDAIDNPTERTSKILIKNSPKTHDFEFTDGVDSFFSMTVETDWSNEAGHYDDIRMPNTDKLTSQSTEREVIGREGIKSHTQLFHYVSDNTKNGKNKERSEYIETDECVRNELLERSNCKGATAVHSKRITFCPSEERTGESLLTLGESIITSGVSEHHNRKVVTLAGLEGADDDDNDDDYFNDDDSDVTETTPRGVNVATTAATLVIEGRDTFVNGEDD